MKNFIRFLNRTPWLILEHFLSLLFRLLTPLGGLFGMERIHSDFHLVKIMLTGLIIILPYLGYGYSVGSSMTSSKKKKKWGI